MATGEKPQAIETLLLEERRYPPPPDFAAQANAQPGIYERELEEFWAENGRDRVTWATPFDRVLEWEAPYAKWFLGGRLNVAYNCVDRHVEAGLGDALHSGQLVRRKTTPAQRQRGGRQQLLRAGKRRLRV